MSVKPEPLRAAVQNTQKTHTDLHYFSNCNWREFTGSTGRNSLELIHDSHWRHDSGRDGQDVSCRRWLHTSWNHRTPLRSLGDGRSSTQLVQSEEAWVAGRGGGTGTHLLGNRLVSPRLAAHQSRPRSADEWGADRKEALKKLMLAVTHRPLKNIQVTHFFV